jgi:prepilin-type N-terminal cleavage/methylation domain-containing protein
MSNDARQGRMTEARRRVAAGRAAPARRGSRRPVRRGFTLIETALATVIVGVGVLAMVSAQQAFHRQNQWSTHASTGTRLGNEIREATLRLPRHDPVTGTAFWGPELNETSFADYDDMDDFDGPAGTGLVFSAALGNGPINARREIIPNMDGWSQEVRVFSIDPFDINSIEADGTTSMLLVEVTVTYQGPMDTGPAEVTVVSWIAPN